MTIDARRWPRARAGRLQRSSSAWPPRRPNFAASCGCRHDRRGGRDGGARCWPSRWPGACGMLAACHGYAWQYWRCVSRFPGRCWASALDAPVESPTRFAAVACSAWLYDSNFAPWLVQTIRALPLATLIFGRRWPACRKRCSTRRRRRAAAGGAGCCGSPCRNAGRPWRRRGSSDWRSRSANWRRRCSSCRRQRSTTISVRIFQMLHYGVDDRVAAISLVMVAGIATLTGIAAALLKRKYG